MDGLPRVATSGAQRACSTCKERKTKCDRLLPRCSSCVSKTWKCEYPPVKWKPHEPEKDGTDATISLSSYTLTALAQEENSTSPAVMFLDSAAFRSFGLELPRPGVLVPSHIKDLIGGQAEITAMAEEFFTSIHTWWPILCKKKFYSQLLNPLTKLRTDVALLLLSMKLALWTPSTADPEPKSQLYHGTKRFYSELEESGIDSTHILQAGILIALYEFGHGIYPATYLTIGACARWGAMYRFDDMEGRGQGWIDTEERKRAWWGVLILDRIMRLGNEINSPATQDPNPSSLLPADDDTWNRGVEPPAADLYMLSSPASLRMGSFARFAQAAHLLGHVHRHTNDKITNTTFHKEEGIQLLRTLRALVSLLEVEGTMRSRSFCTQASTCYSAIFTLSAHATAVPGIAPGVSEPYSARSMAEEASLLVTRNCKEFMEAPGGPGLRTSSPIHLHSMYSAAITLHELHKETRSRASGEAEEMVKNTLLADSARWKAAGTYMDIVEARSLSQLL